MNDREHATAARLPPNTSNYYEVTPADLPLHCPLPSMSLWNSHPRVYLPIETAGEAQCDYCGAVFRLVRGRDSAV